MKGKQNEQKTTWKETESLIFCHQYTNGVLSQTDGDITIGKAYNTDPETGMLTASQIERAYMQIYAPYSEDTVRIKSAILTLNVSSNGEKLGVYETDGSMLTDPENLSALVDYDTGTYDEQTGIKKYNFDITNLYWKQSRESESAYLAIKLVDESFGADESATIFRDDFYGAPFVTITYESGEYYIDNHTIANFGEAKVDLVSGKMAIETQDLSWGGNRMPFNLKRYYKATNGMESGSDNYCCMNVGHNWRLNLFQNISESTFMIDGENVSGYTYIDETQQANNLKYSDGKYIGVDDESMVYDPETKILTFGDNKYEFNENGCLVSITDEYDNMMSVNYNQNGQISTVVDGAGRSFAFCFNEYECLESVVAPDGSMVTYSNPNNSLLEQITYSDGTKAIFGWDGIILKDKENNPVYKFEYTADYFNAITAVTEYGVSDGSFIMSKKTEYDYGFGSGYTVVTTTEGENVIKTVYCFDDDGELVNQYSYTEKEGNIIPDDSVSGSIGNILYNQSFEENGFWKNTENDSSLLQLDSSVKYCRWRSLYLNEETQSGVYQLTDTLASGDYTFSAFIKTTDARGIYLEVASSDDTLIARSETVSGCDSFIRLELPFTLENSEAVKIKIMPEGEGKAWIDAAQLETGTVASEYNFLANNSFEQDRTQWAFENAEITTDEKFNMTSSVRLDSNLTEAASVLQTVAVNTPKNTRETYRFSAWAKANALINKEREGCEQPVFRLKAQIIYDNEDMPSEEHTVDFAHGISEWQNASIEFAKEKYEKVKFITVSCEYAHNAGVCYFDDACLVRTSVETDLDASDFEVYTENETDETVVETETAPEFSELFDEFGNPITETTFTDGEFGTLYRSYGYSENGNDLVKETDSRGNATVHEVDSVTSRITETTDRLGNKTAYEYDASGKTTKVTSKTAEGTEIASVQYIYGALDNMTGIVRGDGLKYLLNYNSFNNLESIGIDGMEKPLTAYTYGSGSGNVKEMTYANGDKMTANYNSAGQMIAEKWYDKSENLVAYYKYTYDASGNIVRSIDISAKKEYSYTYTDGNLSRAIEYDITLNESNIVTAKTPVNSVLYLYSDGVLAKKRIIDADGSERVIYFENGDDTTVIKLEINGKVITSHSKNDSFGRKVFDELQTGSGFVSRQFDYHTGVVTDEHKNGEKLKSTPTTQLVREIIFSDGRTIEYEYDAEERITKVTDSVEGITEYTYDALGQLLTETKNGTVVNRMVYDGYGNIIQKNDNNYVYDNVWKDKLAFYNGNAITYDEQGNPTNYLGHTLVWEKGRQLKSFDNISFTYNANGIRTSKTVDGVKHTYTLDGTKILREEWENNVLETIFDNEDTVCGIIYNNVPYYFVKNLQDDIIAITNATGDVVVRYSYDAWGKCTIEQDYSLNGSVATVNPYRYRGYYYDIETELYYLQSRYYNAEVSRFVNGDDAEYIEQTNILLDFNIFVYCGNNIVNYIDDSGNARRIIIKYAKASFFSIGDFYNETKRVKENFERNSIFTVDIKKVTNYNSFKEKWKRMSAQDVVVINCHATPTKMDKGGMGIKDLSYISKLPFKHIKCLLLLGCNAGHYNYVWSNVAYEFSKRISGAVMASDGTVMSLPGLKFTSLGDSTWKKYRDKKKSSRKKNIGWVMYSKTSFYSVGKKTITISSAIDIFKKYEGVCFQNPLYR